METENRQVDIQYGMIFMLGGLWAAHFCCFRSCIFFSKFLDFSGLPFRALL